MTMLDNNPHVGIVGGELESSYTGGHVESNGTVSYGKDINIKNGGHVTFTPALSPYVADCRRVDLVFNFFMARTKVLRAHPWNPRLKVAEHEPFFVQAWLDEQVVMECRNVIVYHDMKRSKDYRTKSHRYQLHENVQHICSQFPYLGSLT